MSQPEPPDRWLIISTAIAAAILIPLGWWLKANDALGIDAFLRWVLGSNY